MARASTPGSRPSWPARRASAGRRATDRGRRLPPAGCTDRSGCARARASHLSATELREHLLAEEPNLLLPVLAPELQHDVAAAGVAVLLDRRDAIVGSTRDRLALVEDRISDLRLRGEAPALLHRLGDRPDLVLLEAGEVEQRVGRALDVLQLVREIHAGDLTRAVPALVAV